MRHGLVLLVVFIAAVSVMGGAYLNSKRTVNTDTTDGGHEEQPTPDQREPPPKMEKGISFSPRGFTAEDMNDFFVKAKQAGGVVTWSGDWAQLGAESGAPYVITKLSQINGVEPIVIAQFFQQSDGSLLRPLNDTNRQSYKASASAFVKAFKPAFFGLGVEVNALYEKSPEDYSDFAAFYGELYDELKVASPGTRVFTVFQLEWMKGLRGGLFGGVNDPAKSQWHLLADFNKSDCLAFTTYPCIIFKDPSEIPEDYYAEVADHTDKPVLFTKSGWFRVGPTGWESSDDEQAASSPVSSP